MLDTDCGIESDLAEDIYAMIRNLTLPCRASLSLLRRGKDFSADSSEGEVLSDPVCTP